MSLLILDEHLKHEEVVVPLAKHFSVRSLSELRPRQRILDERIPEILGTLDRPTFVTIDGDFWDRHWCHPDYCIVYFELKTQEQYELPELLRACFRQDELRTRANRMGKVVRVTRVTIEFWQFQRPKIVRKSWRVKN